MTDGLFTEQDVAAILSNPVYTGIPPFAPLIDEDEWIAVGVKRIKEIGAETYLRQMLEVLRSSMGWALNETRPDLGPVLQPDGSWGGGMVLPNPLPGAAEPGAVEHALNPNGDAS